MGTGGLEGESEGVTLGSPFGFLLGEAEMVGTSLGKVDEILVLGNVLREVLGIRVFGSLVGC